jgi:hypothetical protein
MIESIELKEFNFDKIVPHSMIISMGGPRSGKSWLIRDLMYTFRNILFGSLYYSNCSTFLKNYVQESLFKQYAPENRFSGLLEKKDGDRLIIMDDSEIDTNDITTNEELKNIFINHRHYNTTFIMSFSYFICLPPYLRENMDYIFLFASDDSSSNLNKIWKNYVGGNLTFKMFKMIFSKCTKNYGCLVIDKRSMSSRLDENIFYYKAKDHGEFVCFGGDKEKILV